MVDDLHQRIMELFKEIRSEKKIRNVRSSKQKTLRAINVKPKFFVFVV